MHAAAALTDPDWARAPSRRYGAVRLRPTGDSRAGELVRERGGEEHPARRGTTEVEEVKKSAVTAVREGEGHGFFSLRYSL